MGVEELATEGDDKFPTGGQTTERFWASTADAIGIGAGLLVPALDEGPAGRLDLTAVGTAAGDFVTDAKAGGGFGVVARPSGRMTVEDLGAGITAAHGGLEILDWDVLRSAVVEVEPPVEVLADPCGVPAALVCCFRDASGTSGFSSVSTCLATWRRSCFFSSFFSTGSSISCNSSLCILERGSFVLPLPMRHASPTEMSSFSSVLMVSCLKENAGILGPLGTAPGNAEVIDLRGSVMGLTSFETSIDGSLGSSSVGTTLRTMRRTTFTTFLLVGPWSSGFGNIPALFSIGLLLPLIAELPLTVLPFTVASPLITLPGYCRFSGGGSGLLTWS